VPSGWFLSFYFEAAKQIPEQWIPHILLGGAAAMVPFAGVGTVAKHEDEVHILINTALGSAAVTTTVLLFHAVGIAWTLFNSLFFIGYLAQLSESKPIGTRAGSGTCKPQSLVTQPESADE
jgi:hypothetical protein